MNIEVALLSKILQDKDFLVVKDKQIKPYYLDKEYREQFKFIEKFFMQNGTVPTLRVFKRKFPDAELEEFDGEVGTEEPLEYWCSQIREKKTHNTLVDGIELCLENLDEGNIEEALRLFKRTIVKVENEYTETSAIDVTSDAEDRKKRYEERKANEGMIGIPTGIDLLDYILKGFQDKQLITLIAQTGVGKTWLWVLIVTYMWIEGYRVLLFTTEMSEEQMEDRVEAMAIGMLYGDFDYAKFKSGKLSPQDEEVYHKFLDRKEKMEQLIIETATDVSNVSAKMEQYEADIVFIDSAYLMDDEEGSDVDWLRVTHIWRGLKKLAKRTGKPICVNSQQDLKSKDGGLASVNFAKAINHESDVVMELTRDEQMIEDREAKVRVLKQREGTLGSVMLHWDFRTMNFDPIFSTDATGQTLEINEDEDDDSHTKNMITMED